MSGPSSAHAKLDRAAALREALARDLAVLGDANQYGIVKQVDPATGCFHFRFGSVPPMPGELNLQIGEVLHNYRCSLDHLIWQLVVSAGHAPSDHNEFPIFNDSRKYEKAKGRKLAGVPPSAYGVVDGLQPCYSTPPQDYWWYLWYLYELNNADKHRQLLLTRRHIPNLAVGWFGAGDHQPPIISRIHPEIADDQEFVSVVPTTGNVDLQVRLTIRVCFGNPPAGIRTDLPVDNILSLIDSAVREAFSRLTTFLH